MEAQDAYLNNILKTVAAEQKYENYEIKVEKVTTKGVNYSSYVFRAVISAPGREDLPLFIKIAAAGKKLRDLGTHIYVLESFFYTKLLKIYRGLEKNHVTGDEILLTPKFYKYQDEYLKETFIMEDMDASGFQNFDRFTSLNWEETAQCIQELAKFHALSMVFAKKNPEEYEKTADSIPTNNIKIENLKKFLDAVRVRVLEATDDVDKERISKYMEKTMRSKNLVYLTKPIRKSVLIHGDFRPNNLMYKIENGTRRIVHLDFQTLHPGSPIYDIMYFITVGCDAKFYQQNFKPAFEHYYSELCAALQRFNVDPEEVYSREDFDYELKEILPFAVLMGFCVLLVTTVDEERAPTDLNNLDLQDFAFEPNEYYKNRLRGLIGFYSQMQIFNE